MMSGSDNRGRRDAFQPPVPLEDRLWRHPSELGVYADTGPRVILRKRPAMSRVLVAAAMGLIGGSVIGIGALVASGSVGQNSTGSTVERIAAPIARTATVDELVVAEAALPSVASVRVRGPAGERTATGVVVRDDGMVLTNSDVLDAADDITVTLDDGTADALNVSGGVVVSPVATPAPDGLAPGDVITAINGADVNDLNDSVTEVRRYQPGDEVDIAVVRDGAPVTVVTRLRGAPGVP